MLAIKAMSCWGWWITSPAVLSCHNEYCQKRRTVSWNQPPRNSFINVSLPLTSSLSHQNTQTFMNISPIFLKICNQCTKHRSINQSETVAGAVDRVKTIKLNIAVQLLILIQCSSFTESSIRGINSYLFIARGGHLRGERKWLFNPSVWPKQLRECKLFTRKTDHLWMRRKIQVTKFIHFVEKLYAWAEPEEILKNWFFTSLVIQNNSFFNRSVLGWWGVGMLCSWVTEKQSSSSLPG